jgi:uncharacterized protein YcbK (DUF882 family)
MTRELYEEVMGQVLEAAGVRYFRPSELARVGRLANGVALQAPPVKLWGHILPTLEIAEWARERVGPLEVLSGYRDAAYNRAVGGEQDSLHMAFNALDLRPIRGTVAELHAAVSRHPRATVMGIGIYPGFVHIDTRGILCRPAPARWGTPSPGGLRLAS